MYNHKHHKGVISVKKKKKGIVIVLYLFFFFLFAKTKNLMSGVSPNLPGDTLDSDGNASGGDALTSINNALRAEAMHDFEEAESFDPSAPGPSPPGPTFLAPVMPSFIEAGGALGAPIGIKEAPVMGSTIEPGSHREFAYRIGLAVSCFTALCAILGISAAAAPWHSIRTLTSSNLCIIGIGIGIYGRIQGSGCDGVPTFPRPLTEFLAGSDIVNEFIPSMGFASFCFVMGIIFCVLSLAVSIIMTLRLKNGKAPHKFGTVFVLTAFVATTFTFYAIACIVGSVETLRCAKKIVASTSPLYSTPDLVGAQGAGDSATVFICAMLVLTVVLKIRTRKEALTASLPIDRAFYEALLGSKPSGHFCL